MFSESENYYIAGQDVVGAKSSRAIIARIKDNTLNW